MIAASVGLALVALALGAGWYVTHKRPPEYCQLSGRTIHPHMLAVVKVDGRTRYACCARCGMTYYEQTGRRVQIVRVTDYLSGQSIDAKNAWFVNGSRVEICSTPVLNQEQGRTPYVRLFDRCSPSLLAFTHRDQAEAFAERNGGTVESWDELQKGASSSLRGGRQ